MKALGRDIGVDTLLAGQALPQDGRLTPKLAEAVVEAQGYRARLTRRTLSDLPVAVLPAVLFLKDRDACVLLGWTGEQADVIWPSRSDNPISLARDDLEKEYLGHALVMRPEPDRVDSGLEDRDVPSRHWYWGVVRRFWPDYSQVILASVAINMLALVIPLFTMNVYDRVFPNAAITTLWALVAGVGLALVFDAMLKWVRATVIDRIGRRVDLSVSSTIFRLIADMRLDHQSLPAGALMNTLKDYERVSDFFSSQTLATITDLFFALIFIAAIAYIGGPLAYPPAIALALVFAMGFAILIPMRRASNKARLTQGVKTAVAVEAITDLETLKAVSGQGRMQTRWERQVADAASAQDTSKAFATFATTFTGLCQQLSSVGIIVIGVYLALQGGVTMGAVIAAMILSGRVMAPTATLASLFVRGSFAFATLRTLNQIMAMPSDRDDAPRKLNAEIEKGAFSLKDVSLSYAGGKVPALSDINLEITGQERIGIIGPIGAGKTSLTRLLAGLYAPSDGIVSLDGLNIGQISPARLRREIQMVPQESVLFSGTLAENIAFGVPDARIEDIQRAARLTGVDQIAARHPDGFSMAVSERGRNLSGGQRQMVALARALLPRPRVLILDEPTSAMDTQNEKLFIARLGAALRERPMTLIVSTHRMGLLDLVDRLVLMDGGRVRQDGPKSDVLELLDRAAQERGT